MTLVARDIERAADAVRTANHSTACGVLDGPQSYDAVGNLVELVHRLPQLVDFLVRSLRRADPAEHYDDRRRPAGHALDHAGACLADARTDLEALAEHLTAAHDDLGHLGRHLQED